MKSAFRSLYRFTPAAHKNWLHLLAGALWLGVGVMLTAIATGWLKPLTIPSELVVLAAGILLAGLIYFFGFSRLALKNIRRISAYAKEKVCLFAFQEWKSYPLVASMIALGIYLRIYSPVPKPLLAVLYFGLGGGLFFSSLHYFFHVLNLVKENL